MGGLTLDNLVGYICALIISNLKHVIISMGTKISFRAEDYGVQRQLKLGYDIGDRGRYFFLFKLLI